MRVAIDATPLLGSRTGVATFTSGLIEALATEPDLDVTGFSLSARGWRRLSGLMPAGTVTLRRPLPASVLTKVWLSRDRPSFATLGGSHDVVHGTNFVTPPNPGGAEVVTVYDLTSVRNPEMVARSSLRYPALVRAAIGRGAWVHVTATVVADEVVELLGAPRERVRVIASGPPIARSGTAPTGDARRGRRIAGGEYILALGTVEPRKGLADLVAALPALTDPDVRLVIAGPDGWGTDQLLAAIDAAPANVRARIRRLGWVDDVTRADLLAGAAVLCMPSRNEGFGYPPLEAMAAGVPVVATTAGALPEVIGDAGLLVDPGDVDALAGALDRVLGDGAERSRLVDAGTARLATFSWRECSTAMVGLYRDAVSAAAASPAPEPAVGTVAEEQRP